VWGKILELYTVFSYLRVVYLLYMLYFKMSCVLLLVVLCVLLSSYVYLLYYACIAVFTLDAGLLARSQCSERPATGHLDTGFFSWFPCAYKQMLRWFPKFKAATTLYVSHEALPT